jgi:rhodanese-related sulfurtransferase
MDHAEGFLTLVREAKKRIKEDDVQTTKKKLDAGEKMILVDVREESEWARGHIPNALHLGKGIIERDIEKAIPEKGAVIAADNLQKMGYSNVISMDGGWREWTQAGFPTIKD